MSVSKLINVLILSQFIAAIKSLNVACTFNSMCMCWVQDDDDYTKMDISCIGVPFARFPDVSVNYVAQLDIVGGGLQVFDNDALASSSGVEALGLMSNRITNVGDKSLIGVTKSLRSLDLSYNSLEEIPLKSLRDLKRLNWLNLHSNHLTSLDGDWGYLKDTLENGFFGDNSLTELPNIFSTFLTLVWLNLDNNNIQTLPDETLPPNLHTLSINNNLFTEFPSSLAKLKDLTWIYCRGNQIKHLRLIDFRSSKLELMDLSENLIETMKFTSNKNITLPIKELNLGNNELTILTDNSFENLQIRRIHLASNYLHHIEPNAFRGLENSLEYLNLENNRLVDIPRALNSMKILSYLYLANNLIKNITYGPTIVNYKALSLGINNLESIPMLTGCKKLLHLNLGYNKISKIEPNDFNWAQNLEILLLRNNILTKLQAESFKGAGQLKELSLSFNQLTELNEYSFIGVQDTLEILELSFAFATDVFPQKALRPLHNLLWLVLDNNNFQTIDSTAFYTFRQLHYVNLESNRLHYLPEKLFSPNLHPELKDVKLGYNFIETIPDSTFHNFTKLKSLDLTGNRITLLSEQSIVDCPKLITISLAYNWINKIEKNSFTGLPNLSFLHLEFNRLINLDLNSFAGMGGEDFSLNVSFNAISIIEPSTVPIHLTRLDLSFNNITFIPASTFLLIQGLKSLDLRSNYIGNIESGTFNLKHLEILNLRDNKIDLLRRQSFHGLVSLQQLDLRSNKISQLPTEQLGNLKNLRVLKLANNQIRSLSRDVFEGTRLEILDLSGNEFSVVPSQCFLEVGYTLRDLDMSGNSIDHLDSSAFQISQLVSLNLARNRINILPDNSFVYLTKLLTLNISFNTIEANFKELFHYLPDLRQLYLSHCGLRIIPSLPLMNLNILDLSFNDIYIAQSKEFQYLNKLKVLRLVNNRLDKLPSLKLSFLRELDVSGNPIEELKKDSFIGYPRLDKLNLRNLNNIRTVHRDCLRPLSYLKYLQVQTWPQVDGFHLRTLLYNLPLRKAEIQITENYLKHQIQNAFTKQLRELTITGNNLELISSDAFSTIEGGGELILRIKDTHIQKLQSDIFLSLTKNLSQLTLDLRNNHINELSPSAIYGNLSWETVGTNMVAGGLQVSGNPLECDCEIAWLSLWLRRWLRESRQIHTASQSDARQLRTIAGRAVCTETTSSYSSDKVLLTLGSPHTACHASALSSGNYERLARAWLALLACFVPIFNNFYYLHI